MKCINIGWTWSDYYTMRSHQVDSLRCVCSISHCSMACTCMRIIENGFHVAAVAMEICFAVLRHPKNRKSSQRKMLHVARGNLFCRHFIQVRLVISVGSSMSHARNNSFSINWATNIFGSLTILLSFVKCCGCVSCGFPKKWLNASFFSDRGKQTPQIGKTFIFLFECC